MAFGALTALTAGAGVACAVGSIFGSCGGASQNCEDFDFALEKLQNNDQIWTEVKDNLEETNFIAASQLKYIRLNEKQIIATQENHARILSNAISVIESKSPSLMACFLYFYVRDQKLKLQINLASSLLSLNSEIKSYRN